VSRTLSANLVTHVASRSQTRCRMIAIIPEIGDAFGLTDSDKDKDFTLAEVGALTYEAGTGIYSSDIALSCGLDANNFEIRGPLKVTGPITMAQVLGGVFNYAEVYLFEVNWKALADGAIKLLKGNVLEARIEGGEFVFEIRDQFDKYNQSVGRLITNQCDADFADGIRCNATPTEIVGTVTAATNAMQFTVSFAGAYANDFFNKGKVIGLTGDNTDSVMEIEDWTSAGAITLFAPLPATPTIGDTFTVRDGCGKSRVDCMAHDNIVEFRGYPEVPGSDQVLRMPIPGQGN
jgi:uncharacterized phage protein (TIGR02218 family)